MPTEHQQAQRTAYAKETCAAKDCVNGVTRELPHRGPSNDRLTEKGRPAIVTTMIGYCDEHFRKIVAARAAARTAP